MLRRLLLLVFVACAVLGLRSPPLEAAVVAGSVDDCGCPDCPDGDGDPDDDCDGCPSCGAVHAPGVPTPERPAPLERVADLAPAPRTPESGRGPPERTSEPPTPPPNA